VEFPERFLLVVQGNDHAKVGPLRLGILLLRVAARVAEQVLFHHLLALLLR
jgi:hypothetical protein